MTSCCRLLLQMQTQLTGLIRISRDREAPQNSKMSHTAVSLLTVNGLLPPLSTFVLFVVILLGLVHSDAPSW